MVGEVNKKSCQMVEGVYWGTGIGNPDAADGIFQINVRA